MLGKKGITKMTDIGTSVVVGCLDAVSKSFFNSTAIAFFEAKFLADTFIKTYSTEYQNFSEQEKVGREGQLPYGFYATNLSAFDLLKDEHEFITLSGVVCQNDGQLETIRINFNNYICWQLVNIYELFEALIAEIYAIFGSINNGYWRCSDYGQLLLCEIDELDFDWFKKTSRIILSNKGSKEILKQLQRLLPGLKVLDNSNSMNWNINLEITLIELMRHIIVHKKGNCQLNLFIDQVGKKTGIAINSESSVKLKENICKYFVPFECQEGHKLLIADLQSTKGRESIYLLQHFEHLVNVLTSFSAAIIDLTAQHFNEKPAWKRNDYR